MHTLKNNICQVLRENADKRRTNKMNRLYTKQTILYAILLFCILLSSLYLITSRYTQNKNVYEILVIQSYDKDCMWKDELNKGVKDCFKKHLMKVNIRTFYLDCEALLAKMEIDTLTHLLNEYNQKAPDLIIACDDAATYSLIETKHPLTYSVPIVFCGVDYVNYDILPGHTNITGFTTPPDFVQCYYLAKQLFGKITNIVLLIEDGYLGRVYKEDLYKQYEHVPEITTVEESTQDTTIKKNYLSHKSFKDDSVALFIKRVDKMSGLNLKWNLHRLPQSFNIIPKWNPFYSQFPRMGTTPYLAVNNEGMGDGRIGGYMIPFYNQTYNATDRGIKIILGKSPSDFPITESKKIPVFDWNELNYWKINLKRLPENSLILNMPFTERYKKHLIIGSIAGSIFILVCIFVLGRLYKKEQFNKKKAQKNLEKEQKELSITMESISDGVISIDKKEDILSINQATLHWLHLEKTSEAYIGKNLWQLFDIVSRKKENYFKELIRQVTETGESQSFSDGVYLLTTNHKSFPISGGINIIRKDGKFSGLVITFRDITDEYTQKEILALSMLAGDIFAWRYDEPTNSMVYDEAFFRTFHIPDNGLHSISHNDFLRMIHPEDVQKWKKTLQLIENGKSTKVTLQIRLNISGKEFLWWEYRITTMFRSSLEKHYKLFGVCLNIQQLKKTQEELIRFRDEAIESDRMKGVFMANMSHEIRTPLNAIVGFSTLLTDNASFKPEERKVFIETINENCRLLLNLINEILDISRIESGIQFRKEKCNLSILINEVAETYRPMVENGVSIITQLPVIPIWIDIDILRLKQLLGNLVNNAIKFTHSGYITLGYSFTQVTHSITFFVQDTGIGIAEKEQKRIFERFYKSDDFIQGGGLGLSICKEIVKRMEGNIRVESELNKGTRFIIEIPYSFLRSGNSLEN